MDRFWIGARIWYSNFIRKRHNIQRKCWVSSILNDFMYSLTIFRESFLFAFIKEFEKKFYMTVVLKNSLKNLSSFLIKCWTILGTFWELLICTLFLTPNFDHIVSNKTLKVQEKKICSFKSIETLVHRYTPKMIFFVGLRTIWVVLAVMVRFFSVFFIFTNT